MEAPSKTELSTIEIKRGKLEATDQIATIELDTGTIVEVIIGYPQGGQGVKVTTPRNLGLIGLDVPVSGKISHINDDKETLGLECSLDVIEKSEAIRDLVASNRFDSEKVKNLTLVVKYHEVE